MFVKAHIYIKKVNFTQLELGLPSMSQLQYCELCFQTTTSFLAEKMAYYSKDWMDMGQTQKYFHGKYG